MFGACVRACVCDDVLMMGRIESTEDQSRGQQQQIVLLQSHNDELTSDKRELEKRIRTMWEERESKDKSIDQHLNNERVRIRHQSCHVCQHVVIVTGI